MHCVAAEQTTEPCYSVPVVPRPRSTQQTLRHNRGHVLQTCVAWSPQGSSFDMPHEQRPTRGLTQGDSCVRAGAAASGPASNASAGFLPLHRFVFDIVPPPPPPLVPATWTHSVQGADSPRVVRRREGSIGCVAFTAMTENLADCHGPTVAERMNMRR
jgi:hypothetical protein